MVADTLEELHEFAEKHEIGKHWFHKDHYDLNPKNYERVIEHTQLVNSKELARLRREMRAF